MQKMTEIVTWFLEHPEELGRQVGFRDLTPLHGEWIREMISGTEDYTLQAHRGSYKSSSLAVAIAMLMILRPRRNIIFLRKTDNDVAEMLGMVGKILRQQIMADLTACIYHKPLIILSESASQLSTNLWESPMGAPQLLGLGIRSSITGKHAWYVITDDICNKDDRESRAERERTKTQYDELQNIRNKGGRIINLGTPWHKEDVFTKMPNIHRYDCYTTGLISKEQLERLRQSMAPSLFAANYELKHIASTEVIFSTPPRFTDDPETLRDGIAHIDAAYGGSDYTAFTCGQRDRENEVIYLYGRIWHRPVDQVLDEIIDEDKLPLLYAGYSACFRKEAGAYGKYTRGLFRVHQFNKLEMYIFCLPEQSKEMHEKILSIEEEIWQELGIPYHVINIAAGDLGAPAAKKYDLEYWSPVNQKYQELTSCSNCTDFQARSVNVRVRRKDGKVEFVHTLNGTAISLARAMVAVLENYGTEDGKLKVPEALKPYLGNRDEL